MTVTDQPITAEELAACEGHTPGPWEVEPIRRREATSEDVTRGLPSALVAILKSQDVIVSQDAAVFELIAAWGRAPAATATAEVKGAADDSFLGHIYRYTRESADGERRLEADARLISLAPRLLTEVKRLRAEIDSK